jgi:putative phosphoribosyl transferase
MREGLFHDRRDAGRRLATRLVASTGDPRAIVLALPRGGVPVAYEVARALQAPLDLLLVRKLGVPGQEELALGALALGGEPVLNEDVVEEARLSAQEIAAIAARERAELARRSRLYRDERPPLELRGRVAILVDDGLATGATMRAAARAVRRQEPARLVIAVPVGAPETCAGLRGEADEVICDRMPTPFYAVGLWYDDFTQTTDAEVRELLARPGANSTG